MKITSEVLGLKDLEKALKQVEGQTKGKVLRSALRKGAKPVHDDMASDVTTKFDAQTGQLAESIKTKTALNKKGSHSIFDAAAYVGVYRNKKAQAATGSALDAPVYAYWLETGVKPHILNPKGAANLLHPGFDGQPFVRPALINNEEKVISTVKKELAVGIERAIKRQSK
ncbi:MULTISPECIES: HK97-gp10 family putative phage morphogenesis protein [Pseudoalteromonas]|uniref:HK97-gp10 family putative phage morphogenesis protein n=1 Tax=Pseudoalteromonas TaxID=53246 RepID=UPI0027296A1E|nr:HK97-gp10 family putative phage morphogenesis protein [Pseudoalteromonas sp.]